MIMVDTNIVLDVIEADPQWQVWSREALLDAREQGDVSVSTIVAGEVAGRFDDVDQLEDGLRGLGLLIDHFDLKSAFRAGHAHRSYRAAGGTREMLLADFMIGAHAARRSAPLITRDARRYRTYFPELTLITPESHP